MPTTVSTRAGPDPGGSTVVGTAPAASRALVIGTVPARPRAEAIWIRSRRVAVTRGVPFQLATKTRRAVRSQPARVILCRVRHHYDTEPVAVLAGDVGVGPARRSSAHHARMRSHATAKTAAHRERFRLGRCRLRCWFLRCGQAL